MLPLNELHAEMHDITETLARELVQPTGTPQWSESQWLLARAVASIHGVSALFSRSVPWTGPSSWQRFLHEQRVHTQERHARTCWLLARLDEAARDAGVACVALKGAALYELKIYEDGDRPMADVDLLVGDQSLGRASLMLEGLGFQRTHANWKHATYVAGERAADPGELGENSANSLKVELHSRIAERLPIRPTDITRCIFPQDARKGLNSYPSRAMLMLHLLLHTAGAMSLRAARLIHLQDIARLSVTMDTRDWTELLTKGSALDEGLWWSFPPLALVARYYDAIPRNVLDTVSPRCPWWLKQTCARRCLSDVSLSYLWVSAFPGIEWARSPHEALSYMKHRVVPDAEMRNLRKLQAKCESPAAHSSWAHLSQSRRMLRWLTSRPARPESLYSIHVALSQPP